MYDCTNPLTGANLGLRRLGTDVKYFYWKEIRAYEFKPFALTTSMMSSNDVSNLSFANALSFTMTKYTTTHNSEALDNDTYFTADNCGTNKCFLKFNFGASVYIKAVLVVGRSGKDESVNWTMVLGNSPDSNNNTIKHTAGNYVWGDWMKEILVNSSGQYMDII